MKRREGKPRLKGMKRRGGKPRLEGRRTTQRTRRIVKFILGISIYAIHNDSLFLLLCASQATEGNVGNGHILVPEAEEDS